MAVSHVKSVTIPDFTGTVTAFNSQGSTVTVAASDLARPSDWNSAHNQFWTLTGNTTNGSTASGTNIVLAASGAVSVGVSGGNTLLVSVPTNFLTTARASNDAVGLNTALTGNGVQWTVNSSGISLNVPAFLTTAALSNHSHGVQLNLTNLSGTTAGNSDGITLSLSAANPGGGAGDGFNIIGVNGNTVGSDVTVQFSNSNGVSFGLNGSTITATVKTDYALSDHSHGNPTLNLTNLSGTTASNSAGFTLSLSAAAAGAAQAQTFSSTIVAPFENRPAAQSSSSLGQNSIYFIPALFRDYISAHHIKMPAMLSNRSSGASSGGRSVTWEVGIYSRHPTNSTLLTQHFTNTWTGNATYSSNANFAYACITGLETNFTEYLTTSRNNVNGSTDVEGGREAIFWLNSMLSSGEWWFAVRQSTSGTGTAGNCMVFSNIIAAPIQTHRPFGTAASVSDGVLAYRGVGTYSVTSAALPASVSITQINQAGTVPLLYLMPGQK